MNIWVDIRTHETSLHYARFVRQFSHILEKHFWEQNTTLLTEDILPGWKNFFLRTISEKNILQKYDFDLVIFFHHQVPLWYKGKYIMILPHLKEVFFPKLWWLEHSLYMYTLHRSLKHAQKAITLDTWTALELNERLNIPEINIAHIPGFFPEKKDEHTEQIIKIDIHAKHNLQGAYLLYDAPHEIHNNFERILKVLKNINTDTSSPLSIIICCEFTSKDLDLREKVIEYGISEYVIFLWEIPENEKSLYYNSSLWVIYSSIYESFPFHMSTALQEWSQIFVNDIGVFREVFGDTALYLDPLSVHSMTETLRKKLLEKTQVSYETVLQKFHPENTKNELIKIIQSLDTL